jgi:hypothetical protein
MVTAKGPEPAQRTEERSRFARSALLPGVLAALLLAGCGQALVQGKVGVEPTKSGNSTVLVRISGTEGVHYAGSYGLLGDKQERLTDTIGAGPTSYEVPVEEKGPVYEDVYANFMKLVPEGHLRVEVLSDGKVVSSKTTRDYDGVITLNYKPPGGRGS